LCTTPGGCADGTPHGLSLRAPIVDASALAPREPTLIRLRPSEGWYFDETSRELWFGRFRSIADLPPFDQGDIPVGQ
jgi:hypothetical protein